MNSMEMEIISCFYHKNRHVDIYRDKQGKYFVWVSGNITQRYLSAEEIIRYLSNMMHEHVETN